MKSILLGHDQNTGKPVSIPIAAFNTHAHMVGATGKGKTTALLTLLCQLLSDPLNQACHFIVDFMGGLTWELLMWASLPRFCPQSVRDRLLVIEPSRETEVLPMNALLYDTPDHGFFKVSRATELILRAWEAQNLGEQPRLARWLFNSFWASAQLGLTIADTEHLLLPGSPYHRPLLNALPERLRMEWQEILTAHSAEATRILDSSRNRMKLFYEAGILRRMFGSTRNHLDVLRFMREKRIVILNLAPQNRIAPQVANAIGGLVVNEILATARSLPKNVRYPTYLWLDEFQRMCTNDLEYAVPEVRQLGIKLVLAHQSFSQLERETCDLTSVIWQPQTRLIFGEQGPDAEILGNELAGVSFDPKWIKDEIYRLQQIEVGKQLVELSSWGTAHANMDQWNRTYGQGWSHQASEARRDDSRQIVRGQGDSRTNQEGRGEGGSRTDTSTHTTHQQLVSKLENIRELANRTYYNFEEQRQMWARDVRRLRTGLCLLQCANDPTIYPVQVKQTRPGPLAFDVETIYRKFPKAVEAQEKLIEQNFASELFVSPQEIERETQERLERILRPITIIQTQPQKQLENDQFA